MRLASVASEAWRNVTSGTAQALQLAVLLGALTAAVVGVDLASIAAISARAVAFHDVGSDILVIEAPGLISSRACDSLNGTPGVIAGALRPATQNLVARALPSSSIPTFEITAGLTPVLLDGAAAPPGLLASASLAKALGLSAGGTLESRTGVATVAAVYDYPDDGRRADFEFAVMLPVVSDGRFDECWARSRASSDDLAPLLLSTVIPQAGGQTDPPKIAQLNGSLGQRFDGAAQFADRPTRYLPVMGALLAFIIFFVATRLRRVELAAARHSGVAPHEQWGTVALESLVPVLFAPILTAPAVAWFVVNAPETDVGRYLILAAGYSALLGLFALLGLSTAVLSIRERDLFAHFKDRR